MKRSSRVFDLVGLDSIENKEEDICLSRRFLKKCKCVSEEEEMRTLASTVSDEYKLSFSDESDSSGDEGKDISSVDCELEKRREVGISIPSSASAFKLLTTRSPVIVADKRRFNGGCTMQLDLKVDSINVFRHNSPVTVARRSSFDTRTSLAGTTVC